MPTKIVLILALLLLAPLARAAAPICLYQDVVSGQASGAWVVIKSSGSSVGYSNLAANTNIKWGFLELTQTNYGTSATGSTATLLVTATAH